MVINGDIMGSDGNIHYQWRGFFAEKIHYLKFVESVMFGKKKQYGKYTNLGQNHRMYLFSNFFVALSQQVNDAGLCWFYPNNQWFVMELAIS
jgi:hypothetical protein